MNEVPSPELRYRQLLDLRRTAFARQEQLHRRIGNIRLAVFLIAGAMAWHTILHSRTFSPSWLLFPAAAFLALVLVHSRILKERRRFERAALFYQRGLERLQGKWHGAGDPGSEFADPSHPYAQDLDIFGRGSLFELICGARTGAGRDKLAFWLKNPADVAEIRDRQSAIAELAPNLQLREDLANLGEEISSGMDPAALISWGSAPAILHPGFTRIAAAVFSALTIASAAIWAMAGDHRAFLFMVLMEILFIYRMRTATRRVTEEVERPGRDLLLLSQVLARLERENFQTPRLKALRSELDVHGHPPSQRIAGLNRLIVLLDSRRNQLFAPVAAILLWEIQLAYAIEGWRKENGAAIAGWLGAVSELEAFSSRGICLRKSERPLPRDL